MPITPQQARAELARRELARRELARREETAITPEVVEKPKIGIPKVAEDLTNYLFPQALTEAKFERGKRNIYGDIFERPASAIRSALIGKGYTQGALVPEEVPTFQDIALQKYYQNGKPSALKTARGFGVSALGMGADIATNPAQMLSILLGLTPQGKIAGQQAIKDIGRAKELITTTGQKFATSPVGQITQKGLAKTTQAIKELPSKIPRIMGKDYTINRAQTLAKDLKDLRLGYGSLKEDMLKKVGNLKVDVSDLSKTLDKLPDTAINKIGETVYDFKDSSIKNIDDIREAIGDMLSSKDWIEATKTNKATLKYVFNELGNLMKAKHPEVSSSLNAYSNFMKDVYRPAEKTLFRSGKIVEKPLRGALKKGAERTTQQAFESLGKSVETSKQALKDMSKFIGREQLKKVIKGGLIGYGGYEVLKKLTGK